MPKFLAVHPIPPTKIEDASAIVKNTKTANTDPANAYWVSSWLQLNEEGKITKILCEWNAVDIEAVRKELAKVPNLRARVTSIFSTLNSLSSDDTPVPTSPRVLFGLVEIKQMI